MIKLPVFQLIQDELFAVALPNASEIASTTTTATTTIQQPKKQVTASLFIAFDTSGSMCNDVQMAAQGMMLLLKQVRNVFQHVLLFDYNHDCRVKVIEKTNYEHLFLSLQGTGGTHFPNVMNRLNTQILECESDQVLVLFLTDGCDGASAAEFQKAATCLKTQAVLAKQVSFHCIGFTSSHDTKLLNEILNIGNVPGTFQYAKNQQVLTECVANMENCIHHTLETSSEQLPILLDKIGKKLPAHGSCAFLETVTLSDAAITIQCNGMEYNNVLLVKSSDPVEELLLLANWYSLKLKTLISDITANTKASEQQCKQWASQVEIYDDALSTMISTDARFKLVPRDKKSTIYDQVMVAKNTIVSIYNVIKKIIKKTQIDNDTLASLISSSYDHITKNTLKKKLDKQVTSNAGLLKEIELAKKDLLTSLNVSASTVSKESREMFKCAISLTDWTELMARGESLCLTCNIARREVAIADPSQIRISSIFTTMMASDAFMDSVCFSVSNAISNEERIHGGFSNKEGQVVAGMSRESISGVVPLYMNKEHWEFAKLNMKPLFGWMTTLDVLGYDHTQICIPFIALASFCEMNTVPSDMHAQLFFHLLRTCQQMYTDFKMRVLDYTTLENRTSNIIGNNMLLLGKLLVDEVHKKKCLLSQQDLVMAILEEELRRNMNYKQIQGFELSDDYFAKRMACDKLVTSNPAATTPMEMFNMPENDRCVVLPYLHALSDDLTDVIDAFVPHFMAQLVRFSNLMNYNHTILQDLPTIIETNHGVVPDCHITQLKQLLPVTCGNSITFQTMCQLLQLPMPSKQSIQALVLQCFKHRVNSKRTEAIEKAQVLNTTTQADQIVLAFVNQCIDEQKHKVLLACTAGIQDVIKFQAAMCQTTAQLDSMIAPHLFGMPKSSLWNLVEGIVMSGNATLYQHLRVHHHWPGGSKTRSLFAKHNKPAT